MQYRSIDEMTRGLRVETDQKHNFYHNYEIIDSKFQEKKNYNSCKSDCPLLIVAIHLKYIYIYCIGVAIKHSILHRDNENDMSNNLALLKYQVNVNSSPRRVERPTKPRARLLHYSYIRPPQTTLIYQGQNRHLLSIG